MSPDQFYGEIEPLLESLAENPNMPDPDRTVVNTPIPLEILESAHKIDPLGEGLNDGISNQGVLTARGAMRGHGLEVLACYKSFRYRDMPPFRGDWGVFLISEGIVGFAEEILRRDPGFTREEANSLATWVLSTHELYHFWIDIWALQLETSPASRRVKLYECYKSFHIDLANTEYDIEEALANNFVVRKLTSSARYGSRSRALDVVREIFNEMPVPYDKYDLRSYELIEAKGLLARAIGIGTNIPAARILGKPGLIDCLTIEPKLVLGAKAHTNGCPIHNVTVPEYSKVLSLLSTPSRGEFKDYIEKYLNGSVDSVTDHTFYRIDNGEKLKFPNPHSKEIYSTEFSSSVKRAGMSVQGYWAERERTKKWRRSCPRSKVLGPK